MYKKMLVPLDGSELAEAVFTYAKELAGKLDIDIVLLNVCIPALNDFAPMCQAYVEHTAQLLRRQVREIQKKTGIPPGGKPAKVEGKLVTGYAAEEILRYADENAVDLILMATHGRSGLKRWAMGNVADKILRVSKAPVLLVRAGIPDQTPYDKWPKKTILVPLDGSELAECVLPHVETVAKGCGSPEVLLVQAVEPIVVPYGRGTAEITSMEKLKEFGIHNKVEAEKYLKATVARLGKAGINAEGVVVYGKAAEALVDFANKNKVDLVVIATHGRSGISRWVWGSVADRLLRSICVPVFMVRVPGCVLTI